MVVFLLPASMCLPFLQDYGVFATQDQGNMDAARSHLYPPTEYTTFFNFVLSSENKMTTPRRMGTWDIRAEGMDVG